MAKRPLPSPEALRQLLRYEPETGKLFWRERGPEWFKSGKNRWGGVQEASSFAKTWNKRYAGKEAITAICNGYLYGSIFGMMVYAHRVAWAMHSGEWPEDEIDHINGDKSDNSIANLRQADIHQNQYNIGKLSNNTSGYKGVTFSKKSKMWQAQIRHQGRYVYLGIFKSKEDAASAYQEAADRFHMEYAKY